MVGHGESSAGEIPHQNYIPHPLLPLKGDKVYVNSYIHTQTPEED